MGYYRDDCSPHDDRDDRVAYFRWKYDVTDQPAFAGTPSYNGPHHILSATGDASKKNLRTAADPASATYLSFHSQVSVGVDRAIDVSMS
ncbi:hypothetical protein D9756_010031 [Leucocoprinus leucothites]|uniref:Uncharacterized protein n=1 Tax=Leucocoprinus leucothites TaxID=201217 RepID=A0A8H5CR70_9AGAR|nr:hypothetical protein D9756_010031 [Leucoagaricus leucothites]